MTYIFLPTLARFHRLLVSLKNWNYQHTKKVVELTSLLATGSAFATPQTVTSHPQATVAQDGAEHARDRNLRMAENGSEHVLPHQHDDHRAPIYVAEVRKEFGAQYQRY